MKYRDFEGTIEDLVQSRLKEIEEKENVCILHAIESGSRAWGFASPDSDYDVRFIYVRPMKYYLGLQHFHKSNATLFEWANSPIVYHTSPEWARIMQVTTTYFSCKSTLYHYYGTVKSNYNQHLKDDMVKYKKYFYVLRPLLACKWIEKKKCPPPVLFQELVDAALEDNMQESRQELFFVLIPVFMAKVDK